MEQNWKYIKLGDIISPAKVIRNGDNNNFPVLSITMRDGIVFQSSRFKKSIASVDTSDYKVVYNGQLVIAFPIDEGLIYTQDIVDAGIMSPAYNVWDVDFSEIDRKFLVLYLHCPFAMAYYKSKLRGTTMRRRSMPKDDLLNMPLPIPPLSIQKSIIFEVDKINELIRLKKEQLSDYDKLAQSLFYEMFGDPIINEKGWEVKKYGDEFEIGSGGTPSKSKPEYWGNGNIPWIGSNMCQNIIINETDGKFITEEGLSHSSAKLLEKGTVLVALVGATIGKTALLRTPTSTNQNIAFVKVPNNIEYDSYFVFYHMMSLYDEFMNIGNGDFKMANLSFVRSLPIIKPSLEIQQSFSQRIELIEQQKAEIKSTIADLETLLASRMQYWFD